MKRTAILALLLVAACSKKPAPPVPAPAATPAASMSPAPATPREPEVPQPAPEGPPPQSAPERSADAVELSVSVNGRIDAVVPRGRPLVVVVNAPGPVEVSVVDGAGASVAWSLKKKSADTWIAGGDVAPGSFVVRAAAQGGTAEARVRVVDPPANPTPEQEAEALRDDVRGALAAGERDKALAAVDGRLAKAPKDLPALSLKGDVLAAMGRNREAAKAYSAALTEWHRTRAEPPELLLRKLAAVQPRVFEGK
jgi:hypothetical protein